MDGIDLFKEYIMDRDNRFVHYDEKKRGFVIYSFPSTGQNECFIDEMFVVDDKRELKVIMDMIRFVENEARRLGKTILTAAVNIKKPDAERILRSHFWHKMKIIGTNGEYIYTRKEL